MPDDFALDEPILSERLALEVYAITLEGRRKQVALATRPKGDDDACLVIDTDLDANHYLLRVQGTDALPAHTIEWWLEAPQPIAAAPAVIERSGVWRAEVAADAFLQRTVRLAVPSRLRVSVRGRSSGWRDDDEPCAQRFVSESLSLRAAGNQTIYTSPNTCALADVVLPAAGTGSGSSTCATPPCPPTRSTWAASCPTTS